MTANVEYRFVFKENTRYPVWTCRDPTSLILGTRFSLILGTRIFNSRDPDRVLNTPLKNLVKYTVE